MTASRTSLGERWCCTAPTPDGIAEMTLADGDLVARFERGDRGRCRDGNRHAEGAADAARGVHGNLAAEAIDVLLDDRQSQPGVDAGRGARRVGAEEAF